MGVCAEEALAAVRLSLGSGSTLGEVTQLLKQLPPLLAPLLQQQAVPTSAEFTNWSQ